MHYCAYHQCEHDIAMFKVKSNGKLDSWCHEGRKEYGRKYSRQQYAPRKAEVARQRAQDVTHKTCTTCLLNKSIDQFPERSDRPGKHHAKCDGCYRLWVCSANSQWSRAHSDQVRESNRLYRDQNPEVHRAASRKRRAQKRATQSIPYSVSQVWERDQALCYFCQTPVDPNLTWPDPQFGVIHHIIPLSVGGWDSLENVALAHNRCHGIWHDRLGREVRPITSSLARQVAIDKHYLHRGPTISYGFGLYFGHTLFGIVTFGPPSAPRVKRSACHASSLVMELSRLWIHDMVPKNTGSWFISKALRMLPPAIIVAYADTAIYDEVGDRYHDGSIYRACSFQYAGQTRATGGWRMPGSTRTVSKKVSGSAYVPLPPKQRYWTVTGSQKQKQRLRTQMRWPSIVT